MKDTYEQFDTNINKWAQDWLEHCHQMRQHQWACGDPYDVKFGKYKIKENDWKGYFDPAQVPGEVRTIDFEKELDK